MLIVCGDFGYIFDGGKTEKQVIDYLATRRFVTAFVDGTHDNLTTINKARVTYWHGGMVHRIKGNLIHLMRGQIFEIEGNSFFTFGGGESNDKDMRIASGNWWREEEPTPFEMAEGAKRLFETDERCVGEDFLTVERSPEVSAAIQTALQSGYCELQLARGEHIYQLDISAISSGGAVIGAVWLLAMLI